MHLAGCWITLRHNIDLHPGQYFRQVQTLIVFDLICDEEHQFEGWFRHSDDYEAQVESGMLSCPICGSEHVTKILSPSRINIGNMEKQVKELLSLQQDARQLLTRINQYITTHFEDVGQEFADEARKIHYGESEERNIRGTASLDEAQELYEEGIDVFAIPSADDDKDKLN